MHNFFGFADYDRLFGCISQGDGEPWAGLAIGTGEPEYSLKQFSKSSRVVSHASEPVIEMLEQRQLLSATLSLSSSLMVFNAGENSAPSATQTLTLTDTGDAAVTLGAGSVVVANDPANATQDAARFNLVNASSVPASLSPGQSFGLQIQYSANAIVTNSALLQVNSNDAMNPVQDVTLRGIGMRNLSGGTNQPSLGTILRAYNIPTFVGDGPNDANASTDSTYPEPPDPSSQELKLQRLVKAGTGPVTIQVLASFTASGFAKSYVLGTYTPGNTASLNELFYTPATENQTTFVHPQGSTTFDPGNKQFGFYFISNVQVRGRVGYSEDALNTWDTTDPRKFRFFPLENADRSVVPNAYVMTSTEWNAPVGYDFTNIVAIVRNVKAATGAPDGPVLGLRDLNAVAGSSTMVFNRIQSPNPMLGDVVHDTGTLTINNSGDQPLIISSYTLSSSWTLVSPPTFPLTVAAGTSTNLTIRFTATREPTVPYNETNSPAYPTGGGTYTGTLVLNTNDPNTSTASVKLAGWWQLHSENNNEPSFQSIVNLLYGWSTNINPKPISELNESTSTTNSVPTYYGEEVASAYWLEADTSLPVVVQQLADYHTQGSTAAMGWYRQGSTSTTRLYTTAADDGQTLLPLASNTSVPAAATFSSTSAFGFNMDGEFSDDAKNPYRSAGGHDLRFYPVRDAAGNLVPNTYIVTMDYASSTANFDFQDNVLLVSNIHPATVPAAPADLYAVNVGATSNSMQWAPVPDSTLLGYNVYRGSSPTGVYALLTNTPIAGTDFTDSSAPTGATSYYRVTAVDSVANAESLGNIASAAVPAVVVVAAGHPVVTNQSANTPAGNAVTIDVLASATDSGGTISPSTVVVSTPASHGTTTIDSVTGNITFMPAAGFSGADSFQYTVSDNTGAVSSPATITINVVAQVIGNPMVANLAVTTAYQTRVTVDDVASASDPTGTLLPTTVAIAQAPAHGTAVIDPITGIITYTPAAGFAGTDSIQYTIQDSLQAVSPAGTITITVSPLPTTPVAANLSATTLANGSTVVDVLASATAGTGAITASSVVVAVAPTHGSAAIDSNTGAITYTPNSTFVGTDTLQYTLTDSNGAVSSPATLSFNVGVMVNNTTAKSLKYTDANGTLVTLSLTGGGDAEVLFAGAGSAQTLIGPHGTGSLVVTGTGLKITSISATGTTSVSSLNILHRGTAVVTLGDISSTDSLNAVNAPFANLTGHLTVDGTVRRLTLGSASGATVTAQEIVSLTTTGDFNAHLTVSNASATPFTLGTVHIGGQLGTDAWSVAGNVGSIITGSVASGWNANFATYLNSMTVRAGGFAGILTAGGINTLSIVGNDSGSITAGSVRAMRVIGQLNGASLVLTNAAGPKLLDLGHLGVTGSVVNSRIVSAGNIGVISAGGMVGSTIEAGTAMDVTLPASANDFTTSADIAAVKILGAGSTFSNSDIASQMIGTVSLGIVTTQSGGMTFGIGAGTITSVNAILNSGGALHLNRTQLTSTATIAGYLTAHHLDLGEFAIRTGL